MSDPQNVDNPRDRGQLDAPNTYIAAPSEVSSVAGSATTTKTRQNSTTAERQIKFERAQKCLENAALVSKRIKEHRKATAELLGRPFEDDDGGDTASEMASTMSERTSYSAATDASTSLSVQDALNIPGISESLANTLKQKEILMEKIKQYKEISKKPMKSSSISRRESIDSKAELRKTKDNTDVNKLQTTIKEKENAISVMQVKMRGMEATILDLREKINEKDQIIEAKNKATTIISDSLSKKEKDSLALLEDTRQQMTKMQENFVTMETEWKNEKQRLLNDIEARDYKNYHLEEANSILEKTRFELSLSNSKLLEELELKSKKIIKLQDKLEKLSNESITKTLEKDVEEEKGSREITDMVELTKKIELLEQLNCQIRQTNKELENKLASASTESKTPTSGSPSKKGSPLPTRKGGRNTAAKMKSPWSQLSTESLPQETEKKTTTTPKTDISRLEMLVQSLNKEILDKEYAISQKNSEIAELKSANAKITEEFNKLLEEKVAVSDMVDIGVCTEVPKSEIEKPDEKIDVTIISANELSDQLKAAREQINQLNKEIDASNKNMVKVKSNHKLKLKQMQKTIDNLSKVSDSNAEIIRLNEELHKLSQRVAELEEEKGNLQLHLVDYDSGRLTESDIYKKLLEMENLAETRLKAISVLETQKFDLVQEIHVLQQSYEEMEDKLADLSQLQNEQVSTEITSVQLEEQIDSLIAAKKELELVIENLKLDKEHLIGNIKLMQEEKEDLAHKLDNYIQENIELTDKLEKLSAEKVSSAESIEIVESLTTQEKLELEEYNKGMGENSIDCQSDKCKSDSIEKSENIEKLVEQSADLNKKIELFNEERQEVMERMNKLTSENDMLHEKIVLINSECSSLQNSIDLLNNEKHKLESLNEELNQQIEEFKRERFDVMKESVESSKPASLEDASEAIMTEGQVDEKSAGDKGNIRTKSVKQLTKEILKLKNVIKEREDEIADCQMKILSLEEQQQKQKELIQSISTYESKLKSLSNENGSLKEELNNLKKDKNSDDYLCNNQEHHNLQQNMQKLNDEYSAMIATRDAKLQELKNHLLEYENQILTYGNTLQQKDKELADCLNQITKLNEVSQKLKSTVDLLEEEKVKDTNGELVKSLNKQIMVYQKKMTECEEKLRILDDEKSQLLTFKVTLENKNITLDAEIKKMQETFVEKQNLIIELQAQQQKHSEDIGNVKLQVKERDEEIHEMKLQLRKESIENDKLRTSLLQKDHSEENITRKVEEAEDKVTQITLEKKELMKNFEAIEMKNKELVEKLKKFAVSIKKKSSMYNELENQLIETQKQLETRNVQIEQLVIQVETLPALHEKLKYAEEELNRLQSQKLSLEQQKSQDVSLLQTHNHTLEEKLTLANEELYKLNDLLTKTNYVLKTTQDENQNMKTQIDALNNKMVEHEIEQKNTTNITTKINSLEIDINQKQIYINELLDKLSSLEQQISQIQCGHDAKVQEHDLYIESLQSEISKYKNRIYRLEESISVMEDRRHSLERKADQLDTQLQEKQKAYTEYTSQEDELITRLAALMDHDRVVEKQLNEIDSDNRDLQMKLQHIMEENQSLKNTNAEIVEQCNQSAFNAEKLYSAESEICKYQSEVRELENNLKRITHEYQNLLVHKKQEIEELESEFTTHIENAIKEKKALSERHEKLNEHVMQLEHKLHEYRNNMENLTVNIEELTKVNQELSEKYTNKEATSVPDYTDQYISEINKLNSVINSKNAEINESNSKLQILQSNILTASSNFESQVIDLNLRLQKSSDEIQQLNGQINNLNESNGYLQLLLAQKEDQIKQIAESRKVTFEMNIPKTEGMIISSTIEAQNYEPNEFDMSSLLSQIVSDAPQIVSDMPVITHAAMKAVDNVQQSGQSQPIVEPEIVAKKAYLCYKADDVQPEECDPFNSDEGWGLGEAEESSDVTSGLTHLNDQIRQLKQDNEKLKHNLDVSNTKLLKVMKKFKELKASNEMLSNELKISKQLSQSSLDFAIESELTHNIKELEKKVEELNSDIIKERREKEAIKKQNEVFNNANDRLTEIKEKLDNEIELWKFKFKEVNDKLSTLQWSSDAKETPEHKSSTPCTNTKDSKFVEEFAKLETENDELQSVIDKLTLENKKNVSEQVQLKDKINILSNQLQQLTCDQESEINELKIKYDKEKESVFQELIEKYEYMIEELNSKNIQNNNEITSYKVKECEATNNITTLNAELENLKAKFVLQEDQAVVEARNTELVALKEKYNAIEEQLVNIQNDLQISATKIIQLEFENQETNQQLQQSVAEINSLQTMLENTRKELMIKSLELEDTIKKYNILETESKNQISDLISELEALKMKSLSYEEHQTSKSVPNIESFALAEKYSAVDDQCVKLQNELEQTAVKITNLETENHKLNQELNNSNEKVAELSAKVQHLNKENDQLLSSVTELRSSISSAVDQRGFEIAELWKQHLAQREADFQKVELELREQLSSSEAKYEQLLDNVQSSSQEETNKLVVMEQLTSLQNKLHDKEEHLLSLQDKYAEAVGQLDILRSEVEDEKLMLENKLLTQQEEYEKQIQELVVKNHEHSSDYDQTFKNLQSQLIDTKTNNDELIHQQKELHSLLKESEAKLLDMTNEMKMKDSEIHQRVHEYTITFNQRNEEFENVRKQLLESEKRIEDLTYEKESELAVLRLKMHETGEDYKTVLTELEAEKQNLSEALNAKIVECTTLNKQISNLNKVLAEHATKASEMQDALENQELEIVTLKDEIVNYESIIKSSSKIEKHVTFASGTKPANEKSDEELANELLDAVPRAELDLALYMLHQRDVRCEELTMELTQLLEERDTLQLRLSDSLRSLEELKFRCSSAGLDVSTSDVSTELPSPSGEKEQLVDVHGRGSRSSSVSDVDSDKPKLQAKLSELRSVKQSRDVTLRQDSAHRQLGMRLMHRDVANLPPEAVEQLAQAHHTLSRDAQSTPTVLLNWLRGKSTPKVVHM